MNMHEIWTKIMKTNCMCKNEDYWMGAFHCALMKCGIIDEHFHKQISKCEWLNTRKYLQIWKTINKEMQLGENKTIHCWLYSFCKSIDLWVLILHINLNTTYTIGHNLVSQRPFILLCVLYIIILKFWFFLFIQMCFNCLIDVWLPLLLHYQNWKKNALHNVHEIDFGELWLSTHIDIY